MTKKHTITSFILNSTKPFKFYLGLHLFVVIYNAIDVSLWPYVSKLLVDKLAVTPREDLFDKVWMITTILIILTILPGFVWRLCDYGWTKMTPALKKKITVESMDYLMQHSHSFFQNNFAGSLTNKVRDLANCTSQILEKVLYNFLNVALTLAIAFFALLSIHKIFAFGMLIWAVIFILIAIRGAKITSDMSIGIADQQTKITGSLVDVLSNISNVKLFSKIRFERSKIADLQDEYTKLSERRNFFLIKFYTIHGLTFSLYFAFCIIALVWLYSKGEVTLGDFVMLIPLNSFMIHAMWMAANEMRTFLEDVGTMNQALTFLNEPLKIKDAKDAKELVIDEKNAGEIIFDKVRFSHHKSGEPLFSNKSVVIKHGEKIGLVGHSGGGKSTFVSLILRLFDVDEGRILIGGQDIAKVTQDSLRDAISVIPQDPILFHRSLFENIAYSKNGASKQDVIEAAKKAHAHDFIMELPQGYDSLVGERGIKLSGGQRQRIAIARAFLKNAPILILDEATSQLDSITEELIQDSLKNLMKDKTTIIIAHRLSTLSEVDRILVFDSGKIVEDGSHHYLLALAGFYKQLWDSQVGGFIVE